jgi:hypothetical protein
LFHELEKWARLELDGNSGWLGLARELDAYSHCHVGPTIRGCLIDLSGASRTYALLFQILLPLRVQRQWLWRDSPGSAVKPVVSLMALTYRLAEQLAVTSAEDRGNLIFSPLAVYSALSL